VAPVCFERQAKTEGFADVTPTPSIQIESIVIGMYWLLFGSGISRSEQSHGFIRP
jgi:hypothetical protein